ncbi:MAG: ferrous iron transport protein A [Spirochaetia bacterium]|nr:ferrous iron transport protein A [Spirochaetia bacterium]MCI7799999.1 ferrous iron transport protein A [Spirochaetia bacterium]MDD5776983.1 FeoA family protein [Treponema sp.]MDD6929822.1 FeoA family protein [Treponema sp.]MDY5764312.1 FeoA family protein [Treponema sp.]
MPLTFAGLGTEVVVQSIRGTGEVRQHLIDLGFNAGSLVTVISSLNGNLIVKVKDSRIALNYEMANKIFCA